MYIKTSCLLSLLLYLHIYIYAVLLYCFTGHVSSEY